METQIKKTVKAGNSSAVILPKSWLDKEVRVELIKKTSEEILIDVIRITKKYIESSSIIGIYLTGSYARGEEDRDSDIDILIITKGIDKEMVNEGIYNILIISMELLRQKLEKDLLPVGPMIKEAKPLLNSNYLDPIKINIKKNNVEWYMNTTKDKLEIIEEVIKRAKKNNKKYLSDILAYTLILRIKTLYIIKKLTENKPYSKKELIRKIRHIYNGVAYERYLAVKNNLKMKEGISLEETEALYDYLKKELIKIKRSLN